jgi:hypothetical protein
LILFAFAKTLLTAKRRKTIYAKGENLFRGSFYLAKRKAFKKRRQLSNLEMLLKIYSYTLGQLQNYLKMFYQKFAKSS